MDAATDRIVIDIDAAGGERHRHLPDRGIVLETPNYGRRMRRKRWSAWRFVIPKAWHGAREPLIRRRFPGKACLRSTSHPDAASFSGRGVPPRACRAGLERRRAGPHLQALHGVQVALAERQACDLRPRRPGCRGRRCHFTVPERGGFKGWIGLAEEVSDISLACRQIGPMRIKAKFEQGEDVFRPRRSLFFKKMQMVRGHTKRNVLVYMVYSD